MAVAITQTANPAGVSTSSNVATYSGVSIGTATADRYIVVLIGKEVATTVASSVTIDGEAMSTPAGTTFGNVGAWTCYKSWPTGTTATIAVTFSGAATNVQNHIAVYAVTGALFPPQVTGSDSSTDMDASDALTTGTQNIATNGGFIAVAAGASDSGAKSWGSATEDIDEDAGDFRFTTATRVTAGTTITITCTGSNNEDGALAFLIFLETPTTTTLTVKSSGGDYTSWSAFEAGEQADLVAANTIKIASTDAITDTTEFVIDGWTTDANRYVQFQAASGQGHSGYFDSSKQLFASNNARGIWVKEDYVRFEGCQFEHTAADGSQGIEVGQLAAASEVRFHNCIFKGVITGEFGTESAVLGNDDADGNCVIRLINCIVYNFTIGAFPGACFGFRNDFSDMRMYNCTAYACGTGFHAAGTTYKSTAVNCLSYCDATNAARLDFAASDRFQNSSNNASTDATAPGTSALTNQAAGDIDFLSTTDTNSDFLAIDSTSSLVGAGLDNPLSGVYLDDIRGGTRSDWDIGADEFIAAAPAGQVFSFKVPNLRGNFNSGLRSRFQ